MFYTALKKNPLDSYRLLKNVSYLTHTPPLIRISPLYKMILLNVKVVMGSTNKNIMLCIKW